MKIFFIGCGGNFHKRCAMKIPNNCNESRLRSDTNKSTLSIPRKFSDATSTSSNASGDSFYSATSDLPFQPSPSSLGSRRMTWTCGRPVAIDKLVNKLEIPHTFVIHSYKRPTVCNVCRKLVGRSSIMIIISVYIDIYLLEFQEYIIIFSADVSIYVIFIINCSL